jgi:hypothetical protein
MLYFFIMKDLKIKIRKRSKFAIILVFSAILIISIIIVLKSPFNKQYDAFDKTSNPESVIPPVQSTEEETQKGYENYFNRISSEPVNRIEKVIYNWQDIFDMFASNPQNSWLRYTLTKSNLENISKNVKRTQPEFYKGTSDEILKEYGDIIKEDADYYKLDWRLILAMIKQESAFSSTAESRAGAYGFMQIMPKTGETLEQALNLEEHTSPINNLTAGIYYFALLVARYDAAGDTNKYKLALAAYNAGSGHVEDAMVIAYHLGKNYLEWDNIAEALTMLGPDSDSLHTIIWHSKPPNGIFTNWKEPVYYVGNIMFYWAEYKKIYRH